MVGYGTYSQPPGTWSDDSSMTFCLAEALCSGFDLKSIAQNFILWKNQAYWTAHQELFDIGNITAKAINRLESLLNQHKENELPLLKYGGSESENGNGSLMRILPLLFYLEEQSLSLEQQFEIVWQVSALTHRHIRSAMACMIYLRLAAHLLTGKDKQEAYHLTRNETEILWESIQFDEAEREHFQRVIQNDIRDVPITQLRAGGYVIESLEASFHCFLKHNSYQDTVLAAVNLGNDTDTTAAIAGGLAGLYYTCDKIPAHWLMLVARHKDIDKLAAALHQKYCS
jgi:ADP-ribosylglycohydrolase